MSRRMGMTVTLVLAFMAGRAQAEKEPLSPEELRKTATHVVTGRVNAIYSRVERSADYEYTRYVAEVQVGETEKGDGLKKGALVYARYYRKRWIGKGDPPPGTSGHAPVPAEKDAVRVYLAKNAYDGFSTNNEDGGFNVIGREGWEPLKSRPAK